MSTLTRYLLAGLLALTMAGQVRAETPLKYDKAVRDASVAEAAEIVTDLVPVNSANDNLVWMDAERTWVKVVTWKSGYDYEHYILPYAETSASESYVVWVTMAPRLQAFCRDFRASHPLATQAALNKRLKQRLGLRPDWQYDLFVELWVPLDAIFRPCVDPDPSDDRCDLNFGATPPTVKNIQDYAAFYKNLYYKSFRAAPGVPWTGLGYSYDWNNPLAEEGESEFVLSPTTPYIIEQAVPTWDYCAP